jgi:hypothetical protein
MDRLASAVARLTFVTVVAAQDTLLLTKQGRHAGGMWLTRVMHEHAVCAQFLAAYGREHSGLLDRYEAHARYQHLRRLRALRDAGEDVEDILHAAEVQHAADREQLPGRKWWRGNYGWAAELVGREPPALHELAEALEHSEMPHNVIYQFQSARTHPGALGHVWIAGAALGRTSSTSWDIDLAVEALRHALAFLDDSTAALLLKTQETPDVRDFHLMGALRAFGHNVVGKLEAARG